MNKETELISPYYFPGLNMKTLNKEKYGFLFKPEDMLLTKDEIMEVVSKQTGISVKNIISHSRDGNFVMARYIAFAMLRFKLDIDLIEIGRYIGRDHTTIIHGLTSFIDRYKQEERYKIVSDKVAKYIGVNIEEKIENREKFIEKKLKLGYAKSKFKTW